MYRSAARPFSPLLYQLSYLAERLGNVKPRLGFLKLVALQSGQRHRSLRAFLLQKLPGKVP